MDTGWALAQTGDVQQGAAQRGFGKADGLPWATKIALATHSEPQGIYGSYHMRFFRALRSWLNQSGMVSAGPAAGYKVFTPYTRGNDCSMFGLDGWLPPRRETKQTGEPRQCWQDNMKQKLIGLSQRYVTALRKHLKQGPRASLQPAVRVGRRAVALGMETLELARIHERAITALEISNSKNGFIKRAEIFFTEALTPIVETHRAARQSKIHLLRLNETLNLRSVELAATNRQLKCGIVRRKTVEAALKKSGVHYTRLLKDSLQLQEGLRQLTHQVLVAQEDERKKISHELQDGIAQTLLGINVRLLALKKEAWLNTKGLKNEIATTQRLVVKSARSVRRVAREFGHS